MNPAHKVVLADFGLSGPLRGESTSLFNESHLGVYAPELFMRNQKLSTASDVFSMGYIFLFMLTGDDEVRAWSLQNKRAVSVWEKQNSETLSENRLTLAPPVLRLAAEHLFTIMLRCIKKKPAKRPSITDVLRVTRHSETQYQHNLKEFTEQNSRTAEARTD